MPDLEQIHEEWNARYDWEGGGDEWSGSWGGTASLWWGTLMPRIHAFLPAGTILELGPGFGRWTNRLREHCDRLVAVDVAERCIEACRERFRDDPRVELHVNDGRSLDMAADASVDLVFSFDSLVHAEIDVITAYLDQIAAKLKPDGVGFVHHSNMGDYGRAARLARLVPSRVRPRLVARGALVNTYAWRAESVTAERFERACRESGLSPVSQELVNWEFGRHLIDCISIFTVPGSRWDRPFRRIGNRGFRAEAARLARIAPLYSNWG